MNKKKVLIICLSILFVLSLVAALVPKYIIDKDKTSFMNTAKEIYDLALSSYESEIANQIVYSNNRKILPKAFDNYKYCIMLNADGQITKAEIDDGKYNIVLENNDNVFDIKKVKKANSNYVCEDKGELIDRLECKFDGEMKPGAEYVHGQYTYRYKQQASEPDSDREDWEDIKEDGWGVVLTDARSTEPVYSQLCTTINDKPVVSMKYAYAYSNMFDVTLNTKDLSNISTFEGAFWNSRIQYFDAKDVNLSGVKSVESMFDGCEDLDVLLFKVPNVTNTSRMFAYASFDFASNDELFALDTSNVTDMSGMFMYASSRTKFDFSKLNTKNVKNMSEMFYGASDLDLDLSSFNTSNVTDMSGMFEKAENIKINLSSFDTSKVKSMEGMFKHSEIENLDLKSFNTKNVENMRHMFGNAKIKKINLSSFDTTNLKRANSMFQYYEGDVLDLSSFDVRNLEYMQSMFKGSKINTLNISNFDTLDLSQKTGNYKYEEVKLRVEEVKTFKSTTPMNGMFDDSDIGKIITRNQEEIDIYKKYTNKELNFEIVS